ncbi:flagellar hook-length control protein FliK [Bradyrhizobium sp. LHD-71]|uniref:flagellar hook-length control protein FliK n=1 Tax=Bradyrhizobium sp. LHD-71 TaxID=3072141 RepID=UPI00280DEAF8|nr:flagellar hook-length control protein FliK [Bradyrhizobium sp. LHD-71]MDQ8726406.1 flagellar hook-length control protein FliK [Bradyrhizobium sp. LHD-71]
MSAVITQIGSLSQPAGASAAVADLILQPGTVIDARVLAVREYLVRLLIAGQAIEVLSKTVLQPGATLKLAVSQGADGSVRLAIVPANMPGTTAGAAAPRIVSASAIEQVPAPSSEEAIALSHAVQISASRQASLAPLFANLPVIVAASDVPEQVQNAATRLLTNRPPLEGTLTAADLRQAFQKSGLFLEATLARGAAPAGRPDLKAALVVFKQVLSNWLETASLTTPFSSPGTPPTAPSRPPHNSQPDPALTGAPSAVAPAVFKAAALSAEIAVVAVDAGDRSTEGQANGSSFAALRPTPQAAEVVRGPVASTAAQAFPHNGAALSRGARQPNDDDPASRPPPERAQPVAAARPSDPAPPLRGALPAAQPVASPSFSADAAPTDMGQKLLEQSDAALARQTLLQVASLPDRTETGSANQAAQARWSFEIPFATPQGTAVAQFEVARDGGSDVEASASRIWRARFSLDVEPAGPVHALISLVGEKAAVRMWAERPETAAELRANADTLSLALRQAELEPGDILVAHGAPQPARLSAGQFLDRAT